MREHLIHDLIPFWRKLRDDKYGGYYGYLDFDLNLDVEAEKGCILNSRITWFFSTAYKLLQDEVLLKEADHAYTYLKKNCMDTSLGGVFWSTNYDGTPKDTTKHTYNQAFAIYALSAYYEITRKPEVLQEALQLFQVIETKCKDEWGYLEAFDREFHEISNEKLSENGVMAEKTMNTLLHVMEAYTELYRVSGNETVAKQLKFILTLMAGKVYNPKLHRLEVFFDKEMHSILDLHSYGHDIEASWLIDHCTNVLKDEELSKKMRKITSDLTREIYETAYKQHSLKNECERGVDNETRIWWVQAEAVLGFYRGYERESEKQYYRIAAQDIWHFIQNKIMDQRNGSEWFSEVDQDGNPDHRKPIVEPWKCPYHNGRMCMEMMRREEEMENNIKYHQI